MDGCASFLEEGLGGISQKGRYHAVTAYGYRYFSAPSPTTLLTR